MVVICGNYAHRRARNDKFYIAIDHVTPDRLY